MAAYQTDNEVEALIRSFRYEMPQGELPAPSEAAPIIRKAGLLNQLEALTRWIEPRRGHDNRRALRPAAARQAFGGSGSVSGCASVTRIDYTKCGRGFAGGDETISTRSRRCRPGVVLVTA